ncbi:hypothetical protein ACFSX5_10615 [Devosia albogilva]|uniref:SMODS and SLOG-associating 2TM effector domain-containing protein n=1 Tax=Devosia albogilva TaxID=429726 RepID=A0ABW5QKW3_9HYPH
MANEDKSDRDFAIAEYQPLREEVNRTIDRMTNNELACAGFVFALILFQMSPAEGAFLPQFILGPLAATLGLVVALVGEGRSKVFRRHLDQVDDYLALLERRVSDDLGWTNHYRDNYKAADDKRRIGSRIILWHVLKFSALLNFVFQCAYAILI